MTPKKLLGQQAEDLAVRYLQTKKFIILGRNYFKKFGEIDIITRSGDTVVFVEVKSLTSENIKQLEILVSPSKLRRLYKTCLFWLYEHENEYENWRIDYIGIYLDGGIIKRFKHIENITSGVGSVAQW